MITSAAVLISFLIALFSVGSISVLGFENELYDVAIFHSSSIPTWILALCVFILAGFPFLILFVLGLRILSSSVKQFSKTTSLTLLGIWIVSLLVIIFAGIEFGAGHARSGSSITKENLALASQDSISVQVVNDDTIYYQSYFRRRNNREEVSVDGKTFLYSNYVKVDVRKSKENYSYIEVRKRSRGHFFLLIVFLLLYKSNFLCSFLHQLLRS